MQKRVSVVLLAAGLSRRASGNKLLYSFSSNMTVIEQSVSTALASKAGPIIVVLGNEADKISHVLERFLPGIEVAVNNQYTAGMSESVKTGVRKAVELHPEYPVMIIPADCVLIKSEDIRKVIKEYLSSNKQIAVASYRGKNGHPVIFNQGLVPEILNISENTHGLKAVVKRHEVLQVETGNPGVLKDFDTDEDFQGYRK